MKTVFKLIKSIIETDFLFLFSTTFPEVMVGTPAYDSRTACHFSFC
ncbi:hypothetical protein LBBP_02591 [Leptospira borgpetersenii serovar Ballum]|uniref:Uncharacterized protein n=1 Tax=Leptospira borgpetersenii serovar Ballum TaxID=280505 RepID=A0A0S2IT27_LEPBO|nr:hypothetical protein LBBP_02591 [Leptospira borgpetersenii serovar Ballum]